MFSKELFGQRVLEQRKKHGETQKELAQIVGVGDTQIIGIENGRNTNNAERIALICENYGVSSENLLGLTDDPAPKYPLDG